MAVVLDVPQVIVPGEVYTASEAQRRLAMGEWAWRMFKRNSGLKPVIIGKRAYIKSDEIIAAVDRLAAQSAE